MTPDTQTANLFAPTQAAGKGGVINLTRDAKIILLQGLKRGYFVAEEAAELTRLIAPDREELKVVIVSAREEIQRLEDLERTINDLR